MIHTALNFFSSTLQCMKRTKVQQEFEDKLYVNGLKREQGKLVQQINETIISEELARKFVLQELDMARQGDALSQDFVKNSGFHPAEYLGALEKFEEEREEIEKIQLLFLNFLNNIANEIIMFQTAMRILDGVMKHWEIGKYDKEAIPFVNEEKINEDVSLGKKVGTGSALKFSMKNMKTVIMEKLEYADDKIQELLDTFKKNKEEPKVAETKLGVKKYTDEKVNDLMEAYSDVIEDIITGEINPQNREKIISFQEEISRAAEEGNNLASVFCAFFEPSDSFPTLPLSIINMNDKSKIFFIKILNTFEEKGFSDSLEDYLYENRENVYALATGNDKFMQYLMAFWYVWENEDEAKALQEEALWYRQSADNGFELALEKINEQ
ncbi:MAG: Unknown protein [uncultured Sulfurovum sp.]|uniref:Uncharacterized protein n=1 Tax=uncultured Sulfurovum sp. TaxID=269237 RepID=A0A6S6UAV2_9BACT|nr:MAG: Unknown protein [uncultured Sulfurovum sp.]